MEAKYNCNYRKRSVRQFPAVREMLSKHNHLLKFHTSLLSQTAYCSALLLTAYRLLLTVHRLLLTVYRLLITVYCLLFTVYCLLFTVYCLLFTVYRLLLTAYCLLLSPPGLHLHPMSCSPFTQRVHHFIKGIAVFG
jgi:hypothetical protein